MVDITGDGYKFWIYLKDNKKYLYAESDIISAAGPWELDTPDKKIIEEYIEQHYEPRPFRNLQGIEKYFEPIFDSKEIYKDAFALLERLKDEVSGQQIMFSEMEE